jgi:AAA domain
MKELVSRTAAEVTPATARFAWTGRIPLGALTILAGPPGLGKTQLLIGMLARASKGNLEGDLNGACEAMYVSAEDSLEHTLVPRLIAAGGIQTRIHFFDAIGDRHGLQIPGDLLNLDHWLQAHQHVRIIVLDPIVAMIPPSLNTHRDQDVRTALAPLAALVDKHHVACILVMHLNKNTEADALNRLSGSIGFGGAARSVLLFANNPDDPDGEQGDQRILAHVKCNVARRQPSIGYRIESRTIHTADNIEIKTSIAIRDADIAISATDLLTSPTGSQEAGARAEAREFIEQELADGPVATNTIKQHAAEAGIAWPTVERAKRQMGIRARRISHPAPHWVWPSPTTPPDVVDVVDGQAEGRPSTTSRPGDRDNVTVLPTGRTENQLEAIANRAQEIAQ